MKTESKKLFFQNKIYPFFLGLTVSILFVFSAFRPGNFPFCYAVLAFTAWIGLRKQKKLRLPRLGKNPLIIYTLLCIYVTVYSIADSSRFLENFAVNGAAILTAVLILNFLRNEENLVFFLVGAAPLMIIDGLTGICQFFLVPGINYFARLFVTSSSAMIEFEHQLSTNRIWGLQLHAHGFAYDHLVWGLMLITAVLAFQGKRVRRQKSFLVLALFISMAVIFITSQRSVVYPFFAVVFLLFLGRKGKGKWKISFLIILAVILIVKNVSLPERPSINRLTKIEVKEGRKAQYIEALKVLSKDPLMGTAYDEEYNLEKPIHNGIVNGWARYGLPWMIMFLITLALTFTDIFISNIHHWYKYAALLVIFAVLLNIMFHTHTPGKSELNFPIALAYVFAYLRVYKRKK